MPDRLPIYEQTVGVENVQPFNVVLPRVADVGGEISDVGQAIMQAGQPYAQRKAEQDAIEAAGTATIAKDENGNFIRPVGPKGGLIYARVYSEALDQRLLTLSQTSFSDRATALAIEHRDDPNALMAALHGTSEAMLQAADPRIRASLETSLVREISERYRGVTTRKANETRDALERGLVDSYQSRYAAAQSILRNANGDPGAMARAQIEIDAATQDIEHLVKLNAVSTQGAEALARSADVQFADEYRLITANNSMRTFAPILANASDEDLQKFSLFASGVDAGVVERKGADGKTISITLEEWQRRFPDRRVGNLAGNLASSELQQREQARRDEAEAQRATAQASRDQQMMTILRMQAHASEVGLTFSGETAQAAAVNFDQTFDGGRALNDPGQHPRVLEWISQVGYMPPVVSSWLETQVRSDRAQTAFNFIDTLREVRTGNVFQGQRLFENLSPMTRALYDWNATMSRSGWNAETRNAFIRAMGDKTILSYEDVAGKAPKDNRGRSMLPEMRDAALRKALNLGDNQAPPPVDNDFNALLPINYALYPNDYAKAVGATAVSLASGWKADPIFMNGVGPKDFFRGNISVADLDAAITDDTRNPGRSRFADGTARLMPHGNRPKDKFGEYTVILMNKQGARTGAFYIDMDTALLNAVRRAKARRDAEGKAAMERARARQREAASIVPGGDLVNRRAAGEPWGD